MAEILCWNNAGSWQHVVHLPIANGAIGGEGQRRIAQPQFSQCADLVDRSRSFGSAFVRAALERRGYSVVQATSGSDGPEQLAAGGMRESYPIYACLAH